MAAGMVLQIQIICHCAASWAGLKRTLDVCSDFQRERDATERERAAVEREISVRDRERELEERVITFILEREKSMMISGAHIGNGHSPLTSGWLTSWT